jgi:DNA-binding response OmpR family regulator
MKHVLLFEAEHDVSIMLRHTLEERGYSVTVTAALDVARQMLQRGGFDLVIVNVLLPDGAAFDVVEMARRRGIKAFLMTGSSSGSSRSQ